MTEINDLIPNYLAYSKIYYVVITDLEGRYIFVNELFIKRFSFICDNFIGKSSYIAIYSEDHDKCLQTVLQCFSNPDRPFKVQLRKPDTNKGDFYWTEWEFSMLKDKNQQQAGILCIGVDMTETERISREAKKFAKKIDSIVEKITDGFYILDRAWNFIKVNNAAEKILGMDKKYLLGKNLWDIFPDTTDYNYPEQFRKAMYQYITVNFEDYRPDLDRWFSTTAYPSNEGLTVFFKDISESKKAKQILELQTQRLEYILTGTNVGTWEWNIQTGETIFNERWAEIIGYTLQEIEPISIETWLKYAHPEDLAESGKLLEKHFKGEIDYYEFECRMKHRNGSWIWVLDRGKISQWTTDGKPLLMSGTHQEITTRKNVEEELRKLSIIAQKTSNGVIITDKNIHITWVNEGFERISGYTLDEAKGRNPNFLQGKDTNPQDIKRIKEKIIQKVPFVQEILNYTKDNLPYWNELSITPVFDHQGEIEMFIGIQLDISKRKKAQQELQRISLLLSEAQRIAKLGAWELNLITNETTWTDEIYKIHEVDKSFQHNKENGLAFYHPEDRIILLEAIHKTIETYEPYDLICRFNSAKGKNLWVRVSGYPVINNGNVTHLVGMFQDVTELKQKEIQLQESENRLNKTIESIPHPLLIVDYQVKISYINEEFEKVFGYTYNEIVGESIDILIPERFRATHVPLHQKYIENGGHSQKMGAYQYALTKNGKEIVISANLNTFRIGEKTFVIVILQDITELKEKQDLVLSQNEILRKIAWRQSHEVRRPVASILGIYNLIKSDRNASEEERMLYLDYLFQSVEELDKIIHKIVAESNKMEFLNR